MDGFDGGHTRGVRLDDGARCGDVAEIGLVEDHEIRGGQLATYRFAHVLVDDLGRDRFGIGEHDDQIEAVGAPMAVGRDAGGVSHPARFDDDAFGSWIELDEIVERRGEAVDQRAADASVRQSDGGTVAPVEQLGVDVERTEVVDEHGDALVGDGEQMVEQGGLAGAEVPADDGDGDDVVGHVNRCWPAHGARRARSPRHRCL